MFARCCLILFLSSTVSAEEFVLADFSQSNDSGWQIVNDTVMGGRSRSQYVLRDGALLFAGYLNTRGGGFASVRGPKINRTDGSFDRIRMRVRGDGRTYLCRLHTRATGTTYQARFDTLAGEWINVELPLAAFRATWRGRRLNRPPIEAGDIDSLGILLADGIDGAFEIALERAVLVHSHPVGGRSLALPLLNDSEPTSATGPAFSSSRAQEQP